MRKVHQTPMKNFRNLLVALTALLTANFALAQTWTLTSAPITNWTAIASSADGTKLVAVASGGSWVLMDSGGIWVSTNSGGTWTQTSAPGAGWVLVTSSADGNKLVAFGTLRSFYTSTNAGATWISNNVPVVGGKWDSLVSSADGCKLAVMSIQSGFYNSILLLTSIDSGATWKTNNLPAGGPWKPVALSADGTRLIVAGLGICLSTNFGETWTSTNSLSSEAVAIASSADGAELAAISSQGLIFVSTNFGMTWVQTKALAPDSIFKSLASSADGSRLVAVAEGIIITSTNSGTNWISMASSADGSRLVAVAVTGGSYSLPPYVVDGPIYTSTNSGATWTSNNVPGQNWTCVASSADGCKLAAAATGENKPLTGGGIWIAQSTLAPQLNIATSNTSLDLSWIVPSANFGLQQNSDLTTANWTDVTNPPVLNLTNLQNEVILSPTGICGFYRLKTP